MTILNPEWHTQNYQTQHLCHPLLREASCIINHQHLASPIRGTDTAALTAYLRSSLSFLYSTPLKNLNPHPTAILYHKEQKSVQLPHSYQKTTQKLAICDGSLHVSAWLDYSTQLLNQTLMGYCCEGFP